MTTYCYTLRDSSPAKATITDVIQVPDIQSAYATVMNNITQFNVMQPDYSWKLVTLVVVNNSEKDNDIFQLNKFKDDCDNEKCDCPDCNCEHENEDYSEEDSKYNDDLPF